MAATASPATALNWPYTWYGPYTTEAECETMRWSMNAPPDDYAGACEYDSSSGRWSFKLYHNPDPR